MVTIKQYNGCARACRYRKNIIETFVFGVYRPGFIELTGDKTRKKSLIEQHALRSSHTQKMTTVEVCEKDTAKIHSFLPPMSKTAL